MLIGRCPPYGEGATFWPLQEVLGQAGRDEAVLEGKSHEVFAAARRILVELAGERPVIVAFDDVQWAETTFLDFVEYLASRLGDARVLLLCLARPQLLERRPAWLISPAVGMALEPLSEGDSEELLEVLGVKAAVRPLIAGDRRRRTHGRAEPGTGTQAGRHRGRRIRHHRTEGGFRECGQSGVPLVGWHSGEKPGPNEKAGLYANVTTVTDDVADVAASWAVADSGGKAGVVIFTDSQYAIALYKARAMEAVIKKCGGCTVLSFEDSPISDSSTRMPQLTTSLLQRFGDKWTHSLAINDLYFDFMGPSLTAAGKKGDGNPKAVSAGDGSEAAYQRIRSKRFQAGTVPEPLNMQGWQVVDELNRAFNKLAWSGYMPKVHLVTADNVGKDGGPKNMFDPDNGYRDAVQADLGQVRPRAAARAGPRAAA